MADGGIGGRFQIWIAIPNNWALEWARPRNGSWLVVRGASRLSRESGKLSHQGGERKSISIRSISRMVWDRRLTLEGIRERSGGGQLGQAP